MVKSDENYTKTEERRETDHIRIYPKGYIQIHVQLNKRMKMIITDSVEIKTSPEKIFEWLTDLPNHYKEWHPDHVACSWLKGEPGKEGSILYIEENIHGDLHKMKFRLTKIEPAKRIDYDILFPMSIICPRGSFVIEPRDGSCVFTAVLSFRFDKLLSLFFEKRASALRTHMKEEGENLKKLLE